MTTGVEQMMKRADALYSSSPQPQHSGLYFVTPPEAAKPTELDEARALVLSALREIPDVALTLAAMLVLLARDAWRWCKQWRRIA